MPSAVEAGAVAGAAERRRRRGDDAEHRAVRQAVAIGRRRRLLAQRLDRAVALRRGRRGSRRGATYTLSIDQRVAPPTSMYSMKRTSAPNGRANSIRSTSSSSLVPRMTTVSILSGETRRASAASMPASTCVQAVAARQRAEALRAQGVEADREPVQTRPRASAAAARRAARRSWSAPGRAAPAWPPAGAPASAGRGAAAARRR